jgi:nucleotide-binding universal stress UspA family protein
MGEIEHIIDPAPPNLVVDFGRAPVNLANDLAMSSVAAGRAMMQYADFLVEQAQEKARTFGATEVEGKVMMGDAAEQVVEFAGDRKADLIVCGSRGLGRAKRLLLGSTSHKIAQLAECSCLTIK